MGRNDEIAVDVVINPKKSLLTAEFTEIQKEVKKAFELIERKYGAAGRSEVQSQ
jgi:RNase P protein component